ncbi:Telomerase-binding protein EST1A [Zalerion maritima]|uniref:Telomerase-binding protein EST1A n=1 Tax=Zalerion maritima TaxID=339359 RepID=A0AAD5S0D1_9PEZI|nr:Telomerase-binding protein EST1A [Zalerion maritima]
MASSEDLCRMSVGDVVPVKIDVENSRGRAFAFGSVKLELALTPTFGGGHPHHGCAPGRKDVDVQLEKSAAITLVVSDLQTLSGVIEDMPPPSSEPLRVDPSSPLVDILLLRGRRPLLLAVVAPVVFGSLRLMLQMTAATTFQWAVFFAILFASRIDNALERIVGAPRDSLRPRHGGCQRTPAADYPPTCQQLPERGTDRTISTPELTAEVGNRQSHDANPLSNEQWRALIALHRTLLYGTVPAFSDTWIDSSGNSGRYRMAVEGDDIRDRELPEDYALRGLVFTERYYPEKFFAESFDVEEKYFEIPSMMEVRKDAILSLTLSTCRICDDTTHEFRTASEFSEHCSVCGRRVRDKTNRRACSNLHVSSRIRTPSHPGEKEPPGQAEKGSCLSSLFLRPTCLGACTVLTFR